MWLYSQEHAWLRRLYHSLIFSAIACCFRNIRKGCQSFKFPDHRVAAVQDIWCLLGCEPRSERTALSSLIPLTAHLPFTRGETLPLGLRATGLDCKTCPLCFSLCKLRAFSGFSTTTTTPKGHGDGREQCWILKPCYLSGYSSSSCCLCHNC